jgi:hypothetical protein
VILKPFKPSNHAMQRVASPRDRSSCRSTPAGSILVRRMHRAIALSLIGLMALCCLARAEDYYPEGGVRRSKGKVDMELIRLVTDQYVIERSISIERLTGFIKLAEKNVAHSIPRDAAPFRLRVLVTLSPNARPTFHLKYDARSVPHNLLQNVYNALQRLPDTRPKAHQVVVELDFVIKANA